jgi:hypothetical protein
VDEETENYTYLVAMLKSENKNSAGKQANVDIATKKLAELDAQICD